METPSHEIRVRSPFGPIKAKVTSAAIKALRHESSRSLPAYVIAEQREMIEAITVRKYKAAEFDADGFVLVDEKDVAG
jgi:hypothetical protein